MSALSRKLGKTIVAAGALALGSLGVAGEANATLGEDVASIDANVAHLVGTRRIEKLAAGSGERHVLELPSGMVVHEYVSARGAVYAIVWHGPSMPNLRELLGRYFVQLEGHPGHGGHHHLALAGDDFVIQASGHRGSFTGRAWVPSLVPAGMKVDAFGE